MTFTKWLEKEGWIPFACYVQGVRWTNGKEKLFTRYLYNKFLSEGKGVKRPRTISLKDVEYWQLFETEVEDAIKSGESYSQF